MSVIYFDFETTNLDKGSALNPQNQLVMVSWAVDDGPIENESCDDGMLPIAFRKALREADTAVAYHAKFEMHWLHRHGVDIDDYVWHDPMLAEKVVLGNRNAKMSMDAVAKRYGRDTKDPMIDAMMQSGICPSEMPQERLAARCNRDVRVLRELHAILQKRLTRRRQQHLYRNRCNFAIVLTHIEREGMYLDAERVEAEYARTARDFAVVQSELLEFTGGINMNSPIQKAKFLYEDLGFREKTNSSGKPLRTAAGNPRTDADTITWLLSTATTDRQKEFVRLQRRYAKLNAALSKNLEFFVGVCREYGGHFHAQFNQTVAATHRLTSSGMPLSFEMFGGKSKSVQFHNMPRAYKGLFVAPDDDYVMVEVDAMQLEFRVAAYAGDDQQARTDISDPDFDAHCRTASVLYQQEYEEFLSKYREGLPTYKRLRQDAKSDTFKPLYGGTKGTEAQERYYKSFAERYSDLHDAQETWLAEVERTGRLRTPWGMTFYWRVWMNRHGTLMDVNRGRPVGPSVYNYPVQNLATAEIVPIAIVSLYHRLKASKVRFKFVNTVHDSIIAYVHKNDIERFKIEASQAFTTDVYEYLDMMYGIDFDVPLGMEMVYGKHWNEGEEFVYDDVNKEDNCV